MYHTLQLKYDLAGKNYNIWGWAVMEDGGGERTTILL